MRKTSLKIVRESDGSCTVNITYSDEDFKKHDRHEVLQELIRDASDDVFARLVPEQK